MSGWKQALPESVIGVVAPTIATALGGPLAGLATAAIAKVFGFGDGVSQGQLAAAVGKASPDQLLALKKAERDSRLASRISSFACTSWTWILSG